MWDATQYLRFGDERSRPFFDLTGRIGASDPGYVADLGCGPGNLTAALAVRWPAAEIVGVDSSAAMIAAAQAHVRAERPTPSLTFTLADVREWSPSRAPDVLVSNAVLQWVPEHDDVLLRWADSLGPGGWLAFQLPGNFDSPANVIVAELANSSRWRGLLADAGLNRQAGEPTRYVELLGREGYQVDAWETTYLHILPGENPVAEWAKGTSLRPVLALLDEEQAADFTAEYAERVAGAYKRGAFGTIFPFRRVFVVLHKHD